jgi:cytochrome c oxidase assembly protein subunit 15
MPGLLTKPTPGRRSGSSRRSGSGRRTGSGRRSGSRRERFTVSPEAFRAIALAALWALVLTIVSGAAVRLTGSGLGCPDWPTCTHTSVVAPLQFHAWVEFGNRLINAAVSIASVGALVAALRRAPRRRDLTLLAAALLVGLLAEIVMGAVVVYTKLNPVAVSAHFLLGLVFLAVAVVLHQRSGLPDGPARRQPLVGSVQIVLARVTVVALAVVAILGTVVTSTGPHGGDPKAQRFHFSLHSVAQLHGTSVEVFLVITLLTLWNLSRESAPHPVVRRAQWMLASMVAQAAVGYTQYFNGDPVTLVGVHVAGASLVVVTTLRFYLGLWARVPSVEPAAPAAAPPPLAVATGEPA